MAASKEDVLDLYRDRQRSHQLSLEELLRRMRLVRFTRAGFGLSCLVVLWLAFAVHAVSAWFALPLALLYLGAHLHHERFYERLIRTRNAIKYYELGLARLEDRWAGTGIVDTTFVRPDHIHAGDLDLFGEGSLFELLCTAKTRAGRETLARWLTQPASSEDILQRQEAVQELRNDVRLRESLALSTADGGVGDVRSIDEWTQAPPLFTKPVARRIAPLFVALTLGALGYSYFSRDPSSLAAPLALQIGFASLFRRRVSNVIKTVREPADEIGRLYAPLKVLEGSQFHTAALQALQRTLKEDKGTAASQVRWLTGLTAMLQFRHDPNAGIILPLFMWSTQVAFAVEAWRGRYRERIRAWIDVVGQFEALCALAGFAYENPAYPFPEIAEGPPHIEGDDLRHPLLPSSGCVPNSIRLGAGLQLVIVSGSNMSGKSTFLRTLGINLVLAQAGAPVPAGRLRCSSMMIGASLRTQDSLRAGTSRFYAEVQRLNAILNHAQQGNAVLFLLDEILQGTNSHDRLVGAQAVLRALLDSGAIGVVTTHDLAIAEIAARFAPQATNMHFQDHMENGALVFDYALRPGVVTRSNAIELMRAAGLRI